MDIFFGFLGLAALLAVFLVIPQLMKKLERNPEDWHGGGSVGDGSAPF
jgi:hypothetical protein